MEITKWKNFRKDDESIAGCELQDGSMKGWTLLNRSMAEKE